MIQLFAAISANGQAVVDAIQDVVDDNLLIGAAVVGIGLTMFALPEGARFAKRIYKAVSRG